MQHASNEASVPPIRRPRVHQRIARSLGLGLAALFCFISASCVTISAGDAWGFGLSRAIYSSGDGDCDFGDADANDRNRTNSVGLLMLVALPLILDIAFLPITVTHDCIVGDY